MIDEVLARFLDGEPEPDDGEVLAEAMRRDERFAREVGRLLIVDDLLRQGASPDNRAFIEAFALRVAAEREGGAFIQGVEHRVRRGGPAVPPRRPWLPWTVAAAACILSLLTVGLSLGRRPNTGPPRARPAPVAERDRGREVPRSGDRRDGTADDALALAIKLEEARWEPSDGPPPAEGDMLNARRLRLRSGRATLAFLNGVVLTLEGPADLELIALDRVFCHRGRLRARVPEGAEGFVVASAGSAVVDLGTEFALNVEDDGRARVMVFEGAAEAALLDAAGAPKCTQRVEQSMAFELDPSTGRIAESVARPEGFVPALDLAPPALVLDPSYAGAVMRSRPRGYWRFESLSDAAVPNEVPGGPPLHANGPVGIPGVPRANGFAEFQAGAPEQFLSTDGLWVMPREPGHAVELWFLSEGIRYSSLVGLFPPVELIPPESVSCYVHTFLVELTARERRALHKPASVRFLHRWPLDINAGNSLIFSDRVYVPRRWHHVVAQKDGARMELYFDGSPSHSRALGLDHPTVSCRLVVGRRTPDALDPKDIRPFVGQLDELAIYDHPLSAEEVRHHFRLATQADRLE